MPITSTTNALATITSVTNTLPTITNGTNIYLQQQITTTDLSTVSISNLITETTAITSWNDPALWVSGFVALIMLYTVRKMSAQNKISAESVNEMKRQYEQKEERDKRREDKKDLSEFIEKHLISKIEKLSLYRRTVSSKIPEHAIELFNFDIFYYLLILYKNSEGLFYENDITIIYGKIYMYGVISQNPENYSTTVKLIFSTLLLGISSDLYKAINNKSSLESLIDQMDFFINTLEQNLTDNERKQLEEARIK